MGLDINQVMKATPDRLLRHLVIAVVLKLVVLVGLWWSFVRDDRVDVDVERAAAHLGAPADSRLTPAPPQGAQH